MLYFAMLVLVSTAVVMLVAIGVVTVSTNWSSHYYHYYQNPRW